MRGGAVRGGIPARSGTPRRRPSRLLSRRARSPAAILPKASVVVLVVARVGDPYRVNPRKDIKMTSSDLFLMSLRSLICAASVIDPNDAQWLVRQLQGTRIFLKGNPSHLCTGN